MVSFCNQDKEIAEKIFQLIGSNILDIDGYKENSIKDIYRTWKRNFVDGDQVKLPILDPIFKKELINNQYSLERRPDCYCLGIDFPTWFNFSGDKKKIMVVGIDPLRKKSDWNQFDKEGYKEYNEFNSVIIGTPYALHIKKLREGRTKNYWKFINKLIDKDHSVYLTDIFKVFYYYTDTANEKKKRSYNDKEFTEKKAAGSFHQKILEQEIEFVKPDLIIAFGNQAKNFIGIKSGPITKDKIVPKKITGHNIPAICMVHLSGATRMVSKENFVQVNLENSEKYKSIEDRYVQIVENVLNEI